MTWRNFGTEYQRMNAQDQKTFWRWLITNTVVGIVCVLGLIVINSVGSGDHSGPTIAQQDRSALQAEAK